MKARTIIQVDIEVHYARTRIFPCFVSPHRTERIDIYQDPRLSQQALPFLPFDQRYHVRPAADHAFEHAVGMVN